MAKLDPRLRHLYEGIVEAVRSPDTVATKAGPWMEIDPAENCITVYAAQPCPYRYKTADGRIITVEEYERAKEAVGLCEKDDLRRPMEREEGRANARTEANEKLQFAVQLLFELDPDQVLTVDDIKRLPLVEDWARKQGVSDDTLIRSLRKAAPSYAHPRPGPKDSWNDPPKLAR